MKLSSYIFALLLCAAWAFAGSVEEYAANIAPLIEPAKLATLGKREAKPRSPLNNSIELP